MWLKKCTCFLLACVAVFGCLFTPVAAAELEEQKVEIEERRASGKFDFDNLVSEERVLHNHIMGNGAAESLLCRFH